MHSQRFGSKLIQVCFKWFWGRSLKSDAKSDLTPGHLLVIFRPQISFVCELRVVTKKENIRYAQECQLVMDISPIFCSRIPDLIGLCAFQSLHKMPLPAQICTLQIIPVQHLYFGCLQVRTCDPKRELYQQQHSNKYYLASQHNPRGARCCLVSWILLFF